MFSLKFSLDSLETTTVSPLGPLPNEVHGIDDVEKAFFGRIKPDGPEEAIGEPE